VNASGVTALEAATVNGYDEIARILKAAIPGASGATRQKQQLAK
jgi:hypothetical protein